MDDSLCQIVPPVLVFKNERAKVVPLNLMSDVKDRLIRDLYEEIDRKVEWKKHQMTAVIGDRSINQRFVFKQPFTYEDHVNSRVFVGVVGYLISLIEKPEEAAIGEGVSAEAVNAPIDRGQARLVFFDGREMHFTWDPGIDKECACWVRRG